EGCAGEVANRLVEVVHGHGDAAAGGIEDLVLNDLAVLALETDCQPALAREHEVGGAVLVAERVATDDDRFGPAGDESRHVAADDRLAEDYATEDVADGAVGRAVHALETELLHPRLIGGDGRALHAHAVPLDPMGGVDGDLVV